MNFPSSERQKIEQRYSPKRPDGVYFSDFRFKSEGDGKFIVSAYWRGRRYTLGVLHVSRKGGHVFNRQGGMGNAVSDQSVRTAAINQGILPDNDE